MPDIIGKSRWLEDSRVPVVKEEIDNELYLLEPSNP